MWQFIEVLLLLLILALLVGTHKDKLLELLGRRKLVLDSSGLIDGRIAEVVRAHFMTDELIVPQFILNELQTLADSKDAHKRERARFGLDIANELQDGGLTKVTVDRTVFDSIEATDDKLVALAKKTQARLYTTDFNLAKVATVEGVRVLNVNELAQALRPITLPGETLEIKVLQKGSNRDQGIGYLDDGTMIVIEGAARFIGRTVPVTVSRMHQTLAGKMVFGTVKIPRTKPGVNPGSHKSPEALAGNQKSILSRLSR